jgi:hypothetical protein
MKQAAIMPTSLSGLPWIFRRDDHKWHLFPKIEKAASRAKESYASI